MLLPALQAQPGKQLFAELGSCPLSSGQVILACRIGYRTFGSLNQEKSNAVIMPTSLNGRTADLVPFFNGTPTAGRLVDTSRFFGIAFDAIGDGVSSSPSNSSKQAGPSFPLFTLEDSVRAQYRVLTQILGLKHIHAAVGLSMGGEQVFAWAVLYPTFMDQAVSIVGTPQVTSWDLLSKQILVQAIESDPEYKGGHYTAQPALKLANAIGLQMVSTPPYLNEQLPRSNFDAWIQSIEEPQRQDANDRVWQAKAIMKQDVLHGRAMADVAKASAGIQFLIIVAAQDRMVTPQPALEWAKAISAESYVSTGACAHLIMNCDAKAVSDRVEKFLARTK